MKKEPFVKMWKGKQVLLVGTMFLLLLCGGVYAWTKSKMFLFLFPVLWIGFARLYYVMKKEKKEHEKRENDAAFLRFLRDFRLAIRLENHVPFAIKEALIYQNETMQQWGNHLLASLQEDATVAPFLEFASKFDDIHAREWMTAIYYLSQNGDVDAFFTQTEVLQTLLYHKEGPTRKRGLAQFLPFLAGILLFTTWMIFFFLYLGDHYGA